MDIGRIKVYMLDRWVIFSLFLLLPIMSLIKISGKYTILSLLFVAVFLALYQYKTVRTITWSYPLKIWLILTLYHWVNAMRKHVPEVDILDLLHGMKIFVCIVIFVYLARKNFDQTIKSLVICFQVFLVLSYIVNKVAPGGEDRLSGVVIATALGQTAALSGIYVAYYSLRNNLNFTKTALLYILPVFTILLTQSRNSLAMIAIGIMGHTIASSARKGLKMGRVVATVVLVGIAALIAVNFVLDNTALGKRLADTETAELIAEHNNIATGTVFDKIVGDRLIYYVKGWTYFVDSPVTGIGMWNYEYVSQGQFPLHTEYMIHLAEGGIIGIVLWLTFIVLVFRGVIKSKIIPQYIKIVALFSLVEVMFCGIYARMFYYEFFYPIFGIAISFSSWGWGAVKKKTHNVSA